MRSVHGAHQPGKDAWASGNPDLATNAANRDTSFTPRKHGFFHGTTEPRHAAFVDPGARARPEHRPDLFVQRPGLAGPAPDLALPPTVDQQVGTESEIRGDLIDQRHVDIHGVRGA
ncbi:hypothetical protein D3C81_1412410 [compost metagenome]